VSINLDSRCQIVGPALVVKAPKASFVLEQRAHHFRLCAAAAQELFDGRVQKHNLSSGGMDERAVSGLHECASAQGDDPHAFRVFGMQQALQGGSFILPEGSFALLAENYVYGAGRRLLDGLVQIYKLPPSTPRQLATGSSLAGAHESDKKDVARCFQFGPPPQLFFSRKKLLALLDANCTTERAELNRGGTRVGSTGEGVSAQQSVAGLRFCGLQRKIVLHGAAGSAGVYIH